MDVEEPSQTTIGFGLESDKEKFLLNKYLVHRA